jgi:RHS repeat-associated protein
VATREFRYQAQAIVEEKLTDAAHPSGAVVRSYVVDDAGSTVKLVIPAPEPDAGTYLVTWSGHGDALGLWRQNADGTLTLANSFSYDTWGRPTTATHAGITDLGFRFTYVGEFDVQWDDAFGLGLLYMHARHYSPTLGRFLQPDPDGSEANLYAYTSNNPVTELDPDGTCFILCLVVGVILFGGLGATAEVATYAATTPQEQWDAEGARGAAAAGFAKGSALVPIARGPGLLGRALSRVPKAAREPKWVTSNRARPALNRSAGNNTVQRIWEKARPVPGGRACSTNGCPNVLTQPTKGVRRNFDLDHIIKWRTFRPFARAVERVRPGSGKAIYNLRVNLRARCTACNRADQ